MVLTPKLTNIITGLEPKIFSVDSVSTVFLLLRKLTLRVCLRGSSQKNVELRVKLEIRPFYPQMRVSPQMSLGFTALSFFLNISEFPFADRT